MSTKVSSSPVTGSHEHTFVCSLRNGLHARPASRLVEVTTRFLSDVNLINGRTQVTGDAKSLLSLVSLDVAKGDRCLIRIDGADADAALQAVRDFTTDVLPTCDEPLPSQPSGSVRVVPRALRGTRSYSGTSVCRGIARGAPVVLDRFTLPTELEAEGHGTVEEEMRRFEDAIAAVRARLQARHAASGSDAERGILQAHLSIVSDAALRQKVSELLSQEYSVGAALVEASDYFSDLFRSSESATTRERAIDVQDICQQLLKQIYGERIETDDTQLTEPSVVVAQALTPSQFMSLDKRFLEGLVLERAGVTSHAMILAASFGIPTLTNVTDACDRLSGVSELIVDANCGLVVPCTDNGASEHFRRTRQREVLRRKRLDRYVDKQVRTSDGQRFAVSANISDVAELPSVFQQGAAGIGLFRTELLYMDRNEPPSEEEQFAIYAEAARAAGNRPVTIRTIDIGGDKPVPYLNLGSEANPFLGYRGVRIYNEQARLIEAQLRAILRASAFGRLKLMLPMITTVEEVQWFKMRLSEIQTDLRASGKAFDPQMPVGIMVEVPSVALQLDQLCREVDFFSIGTNDLGQYFFAVDRGNKRVSALCNTRHPAFLRLLAMIIAGAHRHGHRVSVCGEMGRNVRDLPLLIGLGLDEISVASSDVLTLKAAVSDVSAAECRRVAHVALAAVDVDDVETALRAYRAECPVSSLSELDLMVVDSASDSKEAAIAELVDALYVAGRADAPEIVEAAIWAREEVNATAVGHGFAIPHCKTDAVNTNSLCVLRMKEPIAWDTDSDALVRCVVLLAIRESDPDRTHMQVLAKLARKLMQDAFRARIISAADRTELLNRLIGELDLTT